MKSSGIHTDKRLAERMLGGEEAAFRLFFSTYFPRLFRFALYRVDGDEAQAEDIVQNTLYKAIDKLRTYRGEAALFTWLCTFCRHEISAWLKKKNRNQVDLIEDSPMIRATLESLTDPAATPELEANRLDLARLIKVTMDSLPSAYADALEWKYIDGLSVAEIGDRQGRGHKAAESLLNRAREAFRDGFTATTGAGTGLIWEKGQ